TLRSSATPTLVPRSPGADPSVEEVYRSPDGQNALATTDPLAKSMMRALIEVRPRSLPFDELWARTQAHLARLTTPAAGADRGPAELAGALVEAYKERGLELHVHEPRLAAGPGGRALAPAKAC